MNSSSTSSDLPTPVMCFEAIIAAAEIAMDATDRIDGTGHRLDVTRRALAVVAAAAGCGKAGAAPPAAARIEAQQQLEAALTELKAAIRDAEFEDRSRLN